MRILKCTKPYAMLVGATLIALLVGGCQSSGATPATSPEAQSAAVPTTAPAVPTTAPAEKITLKFWRYIEENPEEKALLLEYADKYTKEVNPNVAVEISFIPWEQYFGEKLVSAIASGEGPDLFWVSSPFFLDMLANDIPLPLEDYLPPEIKSDFTSASLEAVTINGHIISIPNEQELQAFFYNADVFEKRGLKPPKTWDEFVQDATALTSKDMYGVEVETAPGAYQLVSFYPFLWGCGGRVLNDDWSASEINSPCGVKALKLWGDLIKNKVAPPSHVDPEWYVDNLAQGRVAISDNGSWAVSMLRSAYPDFKYGVFPYPMPEGGKPAAAAGGFSTMVNSRSPHVKEAVDFVMWLYANPDPTFNYRWSFEVNFKWPARKSVMEMAKADLDKWPLSVFRDEVAPVAALEPAFPVEVNQAVTDALQSVMYQDVTPEEAAATAQKTIDQFLATYTGPRSASH